MPHEKSRNLQTSKWKPILILLMVLPNSCAEKQMNLCGNAIVELEEACDDGNNDQVDGGCLPGCQQMDDSNLFFDDPLLNIDISIPEDNWETLRKEKITIASSLGSADCTARESVKEYQWYQGDLSINGNKISNIGFRKKGFLGSQSTLKPSLKIRVDKYRKDTKYLGLTRFALNNSRQDPTYMRSCLSYHIYRNGGIPAPRCTLAQVTINGEEKGIYVVVEEIKKHFLSRHFQNSSGTLYEGEAADFRPEFIGRFEQETNIKTEQSRPYLNALSNIATDTKDIDFIEKLSTVINLEQFYRFWAIEGLIWHRDSYSGNTNNYFIYADPSDNNRFHFLPWGIDSSMRPEKRKDHPQSVLAYGKIANRLMSIENGKVEYFNALDKVIDEVWDSNSLLDEIDGYEEKLLSVVTSEEKKLLLESINDLRSWISERENVIAEDRRQGDPDWEEGLRKSPCRIPVGFIRGEFSTTWDTLNTEDFSTGEASIHIEFSASGTTETTSLGDESGVRARLDTSKQVSMTLDSMA